MSAVYTRSIKQINVLTVASNLKFRCTWCCRGYFRCLCLSFHSPISLTMPSDSTSFVKFVICPFKLERLESPSPSHAISHVNTCFAEIISVWFSVFFFARSHNCTRDSLVRPCIVAHFRSLRPRRRHIHKIITRENNNGKTHTYDSSTDANCESPEDENNFAVWGIFQSADNVRGWIP